MSDPADGAPSPDETRPTPPSPPVRRGGGFAGPSDSPEAAGARRVARRRLIRHAVVIAVIAVGVAAAIRFTPLGDWLTGGADKGDLEGIDEAEQEGLLVVTEGDLPGSLSISVLKKPWPIPPLSEHDPVNTGREPWERATDALAADLKSRGARPWNAHTSRELSPPSASLLDAVLGRLRRDGVVVLHYPPKRRGR